MATAEDPSDILQRICEGKTKVLYEDPGNTDEVIVRSKIDITAGDGKKHDLLPGKDKLSNRLTCNIFNYLQRRNIPLAFIRQEGEDTFRAIKCRMVPLEVVIRYKIDKKGSYLKRNPTAVADKRLAEPVVELFLKTSGKQWKGVALPCDDPLLVRRDTSGKLEAYLPNVPLEGQQPILVVDESALGLHPGQLGTLMRVARETGTLLQEMWAAVGADLADVKIEFGVTPGGRLVIADVIDNDSHRLQYQGREVSKQNYRDGAPLDSVHADYVLVTRLSEMFPA